MEPASLLAPERVLRRLEWRVLRRLDGRLQGDYRTTLRGNGTDFLDLRSYEWGDDVRHIDWNVTARMDELYVREFMEDREVTAWLLLDRSRSMSFGAAGRTKELVLAELAGVFGQLLVRGGNRIGFVVYDGEAVVTVPPAQGRHQVLRLLEHLLGPVSGGRATDLSVLLETAARVMRRRSLVVLISDFISEPGWDRPLLRLTERHEVVAVQMVDPSEYELPDAGLLYVEDAETGEQLLVDSSDPELRRRLRAAATAHDEAIGRAAAAAKVGLHVVSTTDDLVAALARDGDAALETATMTFASPWWLLGFLAIPGVVVGYVEARRRRRRRAGSLAAQGLVATTTASGQSWRNHVPFALFLLALALLVVATARPMATISTIRRQATVVLAIDVSNSMAAKDAQPSRIAVAEAAARSFVKDQASTVRIGVVAFGSGSAIVQRPTVDHTADLAAISRLTLGGGTSLSSGILSALDAIAGKTLKINVTALNQDNSGNINIGYFSGATIVLISDGENTNQANPVTIARLASTAGVRIQTLGVGTTAGTTVKIGGFTVATAADPTTLENVSSVTNGAYHQVSGSAVAGVAKSINLHFAVVSEHTEISALFVFGAALGLVVGALLSLTWFGRVV